MSWLNLNDSLNNLKGQISSFASNVLAEENREAAVTHQDFEELQRICSQQQEEINRLQLANRNLDNGTSQQQFSSNDHPQQDTSWTWEISDISRLDKVATDNVISDLKKTIADLTAEKQDLISNLELLDSENQLNTEKLVHMKEKLQAEYSELEEKYTELQENSKKLIENKKKDARELEELKANYAKLKDSGTTIETKCTKCESLLEENRSFATEIDSLKNEIVMLNTKNKKMSEDAQKSDDQELTVLQEKLQLCEAENRILVTELQKSSQSIAQYEKKSKLDAENCQKLAFILEEYEHQVSSLKEELSVAKDQPTASLENLDQLKAELKQLQKQLDEATEEREETHKKYVNILTENVKKYIDSDRSENLQNLSSETNPHIAEFSHQVESILNILLDLKNKCENLERDLYNASQEKTNLLSEKNHEIEKLIQNSEILSQEVITKTQTIKDYESECSDLIKNNDLLIQELEAYKNSSGLQTISESNEDNLLLLESQLETASKRIEELENFIAKSERSDEPLHLVGQLSCENSSLRGEIRKLEEQNSMCLEEKDQLSVSFEKMRLDLENTEYQYTEMNINMETLKEEVENSRHKIEELLKDKSSLQKSNTEYERNCEDLRSELNDFREKLLLEEDSRRQLESQVRNLTEKLQNAKMCETSLKLQYDTVSKELLNMTETKGALEVDLKKTLESLAHCQNNLIALRQDNEQLQTGFDTKQQNTVATQHEEFENITLKTDPENAGMLSEVDLKKQLTSLSEENSMLQDQVSRLTALNNEHSNCNENFKFLQNQVEQLTAAKNELTNVVLTKHEESITYHNEIQRLTHILNVEAEKAKNLELELQAAKSSIDSEELKTRIEEIEKLTDRNNFLQEKCEVLAENLLQEQSKIQQILAERSGPSEKEQVLSKKLERLQSHLIEVEEHYTQELLRAEEKNAALLAKVNEIEEREKTSNTLYTSVNIRANQHVETLQHQLQLITNQRDDLRKRISDAEDQASKQEAALANLQFVLEQFQKEKENDVLKETERIRRQVTVEKQVQSDLRGEIKSLHAQLEESKQGLQAASRLSDLLEQSNLLIVNLKGEVSQLKEKLSKSEEQLQNLSTHTDGKVDKSLIKNLIIGFITSNNNLNKDQTQILKIIATVLDFNQQEHDKVNLSKPQQGWLSSGLLPQGSQGMSQESLSQAFVKFLENESKPRLVPSLLSNNNEPPKSRKNSTSAVSRQSPSILSEVVLPTFADFAQNRNSSSILKDVLNNDNS